MNSFVKFFFALLLFAAVPALASAPQGMQLQKLLHVKTDQGNDELTVYIASQNGILTGIYLNGPQDDQFIPSADIKTAKGAPIKQKYGFDVVFLQGQEDERTQEGTLTMRFLKNVAFHSFGSCQLNLAHDENGWYIQNYYTHERPVQEATINVGNLGINTIQGICPAQNSNSAQ